MRNYFIFIALLGLFVLGICIEGFMIAGSPFEQKALAQDQKRMMDFATIQSSITSYGYSHNNALPQSLTELKQQNSYITTLDAITKKEYDYKIISPTSYKLCTTFSTESSNDTSTTSMSIPSSYLNISNHKKGYDCVTYTLESTTYTPYQPSSPSPSPIKTSITIKSPVFNEKLCGGQTYTIKWDGAQNYKVLRLTLKLPGSNFERYIATVPAQTGSNTSSGEYSWKAGISNNYGTFETAGFGYQINITEDSGSLTQLASSEVFAIDDCGITPTP